MLFSGSLGVWWVDSCGVWKLGIFSFPNLLHQLSNLLLDSSYGFGVGVSFLVCLSYKLHDFVQLVSICFLLLWCSNLVKVGLLELFWHILVLVIPLTVVVVEIPIIVVVPALVVVPIEWSWIILELTIAVHLTDFLLTSHALICNASWISTAYTYLLSLRKKHTFLFA